jgi:hypothetical protein
MRIPGSPMPASYVALEEASGEQDSITYNDLKPGELAVWSCKTAKFLRYPDSMVLESAAMFGVASELLKITLILALCITAAFNPGAFTDNPLLEYYGYNNICVGLDTAPAIYFATPFYVLITLITQNCPKSPCHCSPAGSKTLLVYS